MKHPRAKYLGQNGYPGEVERADKNGLVAGKLYTVTDCSIGGSHSSITVKGEYYNSVLFGITVERLVKYFPHRGYDKRYLSPEMMKERKP